MRMKSKWKLMAFPLILGFLIFYVFPFGESLYYSVIESAFQQRFVGLDNYREAIENSYYRLALKNTFEFTSISAAMLVCLSLCLSLALRSGGGFVRKMRIAFILPMLLPTAAIIPIFKQLFPQNAMYALMQKTGNGHLLRIPIYILYLWKNAGYNIILLSTALSLIPREIEEAAALDGAHGLRKLFSITLPMIFPTLFFVIVLSIVQSLRVFKETYLLYGAYPDQSIYLVQHYMNNHFAKLNYQKLTAGAILFALPIGLLVFGYYKSDGRQNR